MVFYLAEHQSLNSQDQRHRVRYQPPTLPKLLSKYQSSWILRMIVSLTQQLLDLERFQAERVLHHNYVVPLVRSDLGGAMNSSMLLAVSYMTRSVLKKLTVVNMSKHIAVSISASPQAARKDSIVLKTLNVIETGVMRLLQRKSNFTVRRRAVTTPSLGFPGRITSSDISDANTQVAKLIFWTRYDMKYIIVFHSRGLRSALRLPRNYFRRKKGRHKDWQNVNGKTGRRRCSCSSVTSIILRLGRYSGDGDVISLVVRRGHAK